MNNYSSGRLKIVSLGVAFMDRGILFDFDGVIVQSELVHHKSFMELFEKEGIYIDYQEWYKSYAGTGSRSILERIKKDNKLDYDVSEYVLKRKKIYEKCLEKGDLKTTPGIEEFLKILQEKNIPKAIVSGSHRSNVLLGLKVTKMEKYFQVIVSGDDLEKKKPDPEPFLFAARKLGINPQKSVVIEDSVSGAISARGGSFKLVIVKSPALLEIGKYDLLIENFLDESPNRIINLLSK
jgi:HAD superfamily hydrolase (TIGR01509 family)